MSHKKPLAVIKVGGDVLLDQREREGLATNVKELHQLGWNIVILHGGGPQISELQEHHGLIPNKIAGRRITSEKDLQVVKQAIAGEVNVNLVSLLLAADLPAFGCHGASGRLVNASKRPPMKVSGQEQLIDFGEVGDVQAINSGLIEGLLQLGQIPVIASLGTDPEGRIFNINADTTVVEIARALQTDMLLLITQIGGIFRDINKPDSLIGDITPAEARALINEGVIKDGMIPKVEEAIKLLEFGVKSIVIAAASQKGIFGQLAKADETTSGLRATRIHQ